MFRKHAKNKNIQKRLNDTQKNTTTVKYENSKNIHDT